MGQFIAVYENMLSADFCRASISKFEHSSHQFRGRTGQGVDPSKKNSSDITLNQHPDEWGETILALQKVVLNGLIRYVREHPFLLAGAISMQSRGADGRPREITHDVVSQRSDAELTQMIGAAYRLGTINIQKYRRGEGGYFHWHSEHYPHPVDPAQDSLHRVLLWMFFLNDVAEGGETEFYYQQLKVQPRRGTMIIAPATFTHTHRGAMPVSSDKYIFTSWVMFQAAARMYGKA